jgi:predicted enzyme related to lactoylglutathione lyase
MPPRLLIRDIIVDCHDPEALASFWSELLGRPVAGRAGPYVWLERGDAVGLGFQRTSAPKAAKNRVHVDLGSEHPAKEAERVEQLGGRRLAGYEDGGFLVMADPEGNEFCIIPSEPFEVDDQGRADYQ